MDLCHGWSHRRIPMSSTRRYLPDELYRQCDRVSGPFWSKVEDQYIQILSDISLKLVCEAVSIHHNTVCYNIPTEDGFNAESLRMEAAARANMEAESSDEDEYVVSDEDIEYPTETYM